MTKRIVRQFLRAVRGTRSQAAFSRRLGFASNVAAQWESGRRVPSAATALAVCVRLGIDLGAALTKFHEATAPLIGVRGRGRAASVEPESVAAWLRAHRARTRAIEVSKRTGLSGSKLSRIYSGVCGVRLTDFFAIVQATTGRLTDLIAALVDVEAVPDAAQVHARVEASRALAFAQPWSSAVVALLETDEYRSSSERTATFVANRLGIAESVAQRCITALVRVGLVRRRAKKHRVVQALTVDTGDPNRASLLQRHWARVATERLEASAERDLCAYNVFSASRADFERIRELQKQFFREVRTIISGSEPSETAGLMVLHLIDFGGAVSRCPSTYN